LRVALKLEYYSPSHTY